ncbi:DUF6517 family protein [Haloplanus halobius]|uniref:DUF6517 family protein n=1 Tax=Haloplanus halobius TaxID=2934938 RepID=UPI00200D711F|nr:DUF6517 family protein [Haloplanus sp. XH21]
MPTRRGVTASAVGLLTMTAGCGFITGSESLSFSASPATVTDQAISETGYEEVTVTDQVVTREFSVAGQTREVEVTNQLAQYERQVDLGPLGSERAAVFVAFTSPQVEIATESFNPIADMSEREVLQQFESQYESISVGDAVGERTVTIVDQSATVTKFEGTATLAGAEVDVYLHAATVQHESDYVVTVAIYPQQLSDEEENVVTLLEGLEHATSE